jgi:WD40 repeat protein
MRTRAAIALAAAVVWLGSAPFAHSQYFGQNQVQYRDFKFEILKTQHFDVYYYPEEKAAAEIVGRLGERWFARYAKLFNHTIRDRQPVMLYASASDFRQTNVVQGIGEGTGGVTEGMRRRIVMPAAGAIGETSHVLGHELVHAFQYDIASKGARGRGMQGGGNFERLPLWFVEGLAEYLSLGPVDSQTAMWLRDAVQSKKLPTLKQLGNPRFFPYRFGHAFWAYVGGRWGDDVVIRVYREGTRSGDAIGAIKRVLGQDEKVFSKEWGEAVNREYAGFLEAQKDPSSYGPLLINKKRGGGELNLGPALSPDGKRIVFLSEKDLFSIDLFLADTETGKVIRKLTSTATDPHFDSLQFIESAGAWSADGHRFVQSALRNGSAAILVIEPESGKKLEEVEFKDLSQVDNPVFTPDVDHVIFSAMQGGLLDLWDYDLKTKERKRLTNDPWAELEPSVSPDGRTIAFTTDRFTSRMDDLDFGNYRIGLLDRASGEIREVQGYRNARNSNPQWSPDGKTIFFVSDVMGGADVHRVELATGELRQVTQLRTGVYGITPLSPSLSVAHQSGRIAYTAREDGKHDIYAIDDPAKQAGIVVPEKYAFAPQGESIREARRIVESRPATSESQPRPGSTGAVAAEGSTGDAKSTAPVTGAPGAPGTKKIPGLTEAPPAPPAVPLAETVPAINGGTAVLPPYNRVASKVEQALQDPDTGLPPPSAPAPRTEPYKPKMGLTYVGQPSIGVGVDRFGSYVGGSTALYFSDMLGNHNLSIAVQSMGEVKDIGGMAVYSNLAHRFDWAVGASYIPYLFLGGASTTLTNTGAIVDQYLLYRQTNANVFVAGAYPFNRADRVEVQAGASRYGFSGELRTEAWDYATGSYLGNDKQSIDTGFKPLYLGQVSTALVHDTSVFGATSPIVGSRARLEVSPSIGSKYSGGGSVQFTDVLADVRGYFMPVRPLTLAVRALHYGRYGNGADDPRFQSIYLGYPELLRGYSNITASECVPNTNSQCPIFDRLFGSRMVLANAELRAPLWGLLKGRLTYGPVPIEIGAFADAGVAWFGSCTGGGVNQGIYYGPVCGVNDQTPKLLGGNQQWLTSVGGVARVNVLGFAVLQVSYAKPLQRSGRGWVWEWALAPGF